MSEEHANASGLNVESMAPTKLKPKSPRSRSGGVYLPSARLDIMTENDERAMASPVDAREEEAISPGNRRAAVSHLVQKLLPVHSPAKLGGNKVLSRGKKIPAATGIPSVLYPRENNRLSWILSKIALERWRATTTSVSLDFMSTISADSIATSVPAPIAIPRSACASAAVCE